MGRSTENVWLHRFAFVLAVLTLLMVALGGVVTTKGVGMSVPDWPTTYGEHLFLFPFSKWIGGVFFEHSHRLWGYLVGFFSAVLAIWTWARDTKGRERWVGISAMILAGALMGYHKPWMLVSVAAVSMFAAIWAGVNAMRQPSHQLRWLGVIILAGVIVQGVIGGLRVLLDEKWGTEFGVFHATIAQLFLLLAGSIVLITSDWWAKASRMFHGGALRRFVFATTLLILLQLIFGATMRHQHAGLAVPDLPLAYGKLWPATDASSVAAYNSHRIEAAGENPISAGHIVIHMLHRYTGVLIAALVIVCATMMFRRGGTVQRRFATAWIALVLLQVTLGILTITSERKVDVTTTHVAVGALTFLIGWISFLVSSRNAVESEAIAANELLSPKGAELEHA
ncbi:MAG TPA: COX15/CtaA family protein [Candidatus Acidoferrum sp.]|nr:COX15/CtaA family protein [Candidatus Acidoferrum sp.]